MKRARPSAFSEFVRAVACLIVALAGLVDAVASRVAEQPIARPVASPRAASPRLSVVPSEDLLPAALRRLGYKEAEVRSLASRVDSEGSVEARLSAALRFARVAS